MSTCTQESVVARQPGVSVSVSSCEGRHVLCVSRWYDDMPNKWGGRGVRKACDHDGREFPSSDAAFAFALDRGYCRRFYFPELRARRLLNPQAQRAVRERARAFVAGGPNRRAIVGDGAAALICGA